MTLSNDHSCAHFREELDDLTVKQLKEILTINRVNFKGCCEKNELKERVLRLWDDHVSSLREYSSLEYELIKFN